MAKLKQSIAVQRQIPEHVRENYPVFVEFVKLYYEFLEDTQSTNLESIRDIDTTLESFIDRFKSELAKNMPVDLSTDNRLLLKHLREFYLSRGSESSYKFLFRTLFNKEATLFYPSTQILRVSDGKWKQDVSIFVKVTGTTTDLSSLSGQFITIKTSRKTIKTFSENVLQYNQNVYEVFIQRDYLNEIEVGSTIEYSDGTNTFTGTILECPVKLSIYKEGKGFKVGQLYALKTNIGRGCIIKVTKVNGDGAIKAVQVIRFGLDYQSTFYSYLSSKDVVAFEYVHPVELAIGSPGSPATAPGYNMGDPAYNESHGGFIDYGFASRQEYFYYDENIPVGSPDRRSDRYYADPSYVGDVIQQFYTDSAEKVIDEDLAIIQIDLGAVARYPGYYQKADGFLSDEIYIHDGKYYQAFSYVIRVEEELRRYADIVKALVHPAGMKGFAEYNIVKEIEVSASTPLLSQLLQFTDVVVGIDDRGYGYDAMKAEYDPLGQIVYLPFEGANKVYSRQGKANVFPTKNIEEQIIHTEDILRSFHRGFPDEFFTVLSLASNSVNKIASDSISEYVEAIANEIEKKFADGTLNSEVITSILERALAELIIIAEANQLSYAKLVEDTVEQQASNSILHTIKNMLESIDTTNADNKYIDYVKILSDNTELVTDLLSNELEKIFNIDSINLDEKQITRLEKNMIEELQLVEESKIISAVKSLLEEISLLEISSNDYTKPLNDAFTASDIADIIRAKVFEEQQTLDEAFTIARSQFSYDLIELIEDVYAIALEKTISETVIIDEVFQLGEYSKSGIDDQINIAELYSAMISRVCEDVVSSISDAYLGHSIDKTINEVQPLVEVTSKDLVKGTKQESINIFTSGSIRSTPTMYDLESYGVPADNYQASLTTFS